MSMSFEQYSERLRKLIKRPKSRMLLRAENFVKGGGPAAFQLTSGAFLPKFVTLWELFDHRKQFNTFIEMFARKACEIHQKQPFTAIVTSTATAKYILEHAHAAIESQSDHVSLHYLGDYPLLDSENRDLLDFKGENVLIATDVIATGGLVKKMADIVEEVGGHPIAVLCAVLIGPELIEKPLLSFGREKTNGLRIHPLTTLGVPAVTQNGAKERLRVSKIDPVTVLPTDELLLPNGFHPHFNETEMFAHFESAEALDFDFYGMDSGRLTTAVRIKPLIARHRKTLWEALEPRVSSGETLVTTFQREDVLFKEFVEDNLKPPRPPFVFMPKRGSLATSNSYFLLPTELDRIRGKKIVLLLSEVHTSERLRNLASLLVSHGADSITVVCLVNRMGVYTSSFISRLERMVRGVGHKVAKSKQGSDRSKKSAEKSEQHTGFEFLFLYGLPDLSGSDIKRMHETVHALFDYYTRQTRVPSFRRSMQQDLKYFQLKSMTSYRFEQARSHPLSSPFRLAIAKGEEPITVATREGKLALLCSRLVAQRDFRPFIEAIRDRDLRDKDTLYKIFGVLLSDLSYLKMTGTFEELRRTLLVEIKELRKTRLEFERRHLGGASRGPSRMIDTFIDSETHLLFGLALFSYLDYEYDYDSFILETMTCGLKPEDWVLFPGNFVSCYENERMAWCLSMLMHLSRHDFRQPKAAVQLKRDLESRIDGLLDGLDIILPGKGDGVTAMRQRVKANLSLLLTELGVQELTEKYQVIRFLQSKIIAVKRGHNPIDSSLETALLELQEVLPDPTAGDDPVHLQRRIRVRRDMTKKALEDAIYTAGILEEIADAVRQMLVFTPASREDGERFAAEPGLPGFAEDIKQLGDIFQKIRIENQFSKQDVEDLIDLRNRIAFDLWDPNSYLRYLLLRYMVPLREVMDSALNYANERLRAFGYEDVWEPIRAKLKEWSPEWRVLIEPQLLREILRNILSNVRHSFVGYQLGPSESYSDLVTLEVEEILHRAPSLRGEELSYFKITVSSRGMVFRGVRKNATVELHRREIESFAGELDIESLPEGGGTIVRLLLLARQMPASALAEEKIEEEELS